MGRVAGKVHIMGIGALLATGNETVSAVLRVMGLSQERTDPKYQQVLSRAAWTGLEVSRFCRIVTENL